MEKSNNKLSVVSTTESRVVSLPVVNGQLILTKDSNQIFFDYDGRRNNYTLNVKEITSIQQYTQSNSVGLYYITDVKSLFYYTGQEWIAVTNTNSFSNIIFGDEPETGELNKLYVKDDRIDIWKGEKYHTVANVSLWDSI